MNEPNHELKHHLQSPQALLRSTLIAVAGAALLLVTVVLPAEYGVDPTGLGRVMGLTQMGQIKLSLAREAEAHQAAENAARDASAPVVPSGEAGPQAATGESAERADVTTLALGPNEGREIKMVMREGARAKYSWTAVGGLVNFDMHAEPSAGPSGSYHTYGKSNGVGSDSGELIAQFNGNHGWYWRNIGEDSVTVTLHTRGEYSEVRVMQ